MIPPVSNVKKILYPDLNFNLSSINPMIPAEITVKKKMLSSFRKAGKKIISNIKQIENPIRILSPPDFATAGRAFL